MQLTWLGGNVVGGGIIWCSGNVVGRRIIWLVAGTIFWFGNVVGGPISGLRGKVVGGQVVRLRACALWLDQSLMKYFDHWSSAMYNPLELREARNIAVLGQRVLMSQ